MEAVVMEIKTDNMGIQKPVNTEQRQDFSVRQTLTEKLIVGKDTVSISGNATTSEVTYSQDLSINTLENDGYNQLRGLVANLLKEQGIDFKVAIGNEEVGINHISQEEAQELVSDDGYFGIEQTSDRIVDFAIAISGNDPSRIDAIRSGIQKGFDEALEAFGGSLPEISHNTYDAVNAKLDAWVESSNENQEV